MDRVPSATVIQDSGLPLALAGEPFGEIRNALPICATRWTRRSPG